MEHELVIKFWRSSLENEEFLTTVEDRLAEALGAVGSVDGYDVSAKEINLFILTADPRAAFRKAKAVLESSSGLAGVSVAHRLAGGAAFTSLWPLRPMRKFSLPDAR